MPNVDITTRAVIHRPVAVVSAYAADPDNAPRWYVNIEAVEWRTDPPVRVGSRIAFIAHFLGRRLEYVYEVVEFEPGRRMVMRTAAGPFPMETSYTWSAEDASSTTMVLRNRGAPSGFAALIAPFVGMAMRRANRTDLKRLKQILESRTPE